MAETLPVGGPLAGNHNKPLANHGPTRRDRVMGDRVMAALALLMSGAGMACAADQSADAATATSHFGRPQIARTAAIVLDLRVQLMARELALDATQQARLRDILRAQRDNIARAWSDPSVPAALRIAATQTTGEKTADRIRAILTDEQREKYMKSHQHNAPSGDVERWIEGGEGSAPATGPAIAKGN